MLVFMRPVQPRVSFREAKPCAPPWYVQKLLYLLTFGYSTHEPARTAFHQGLRIFKDSLTKDPAKRQLADQLLGSTLESVLQVVTKAVAHYEQQRSSSPIRSGLIAFSQRLHYYGNIVDVLVQHHPEYVALVWGAMKLLFGVSAKSTLPT